MSSGAGFVIYGLWFWLTVRPGWLYPCGKLRQIQSASQQQQHKKRREQEAASPHHMG